MNTKTLVTDGQLGQLAVRQHDLFRRVKSGSYANFDDVMAALQTVIEGKMPEPPVLVVEPGLTKWRTFLIGGVAKKELLKRVEAGFTVSGYAKSLVNNRAFTTLDKEKPIDTIVLTPADFGYTHNPTTTELLDPTRLREWSEQNAERLNGHVVELLPAEAGPHIRDQYKDQSNREVLWIAMERITDSDGRPDVFTVRRISDGGRWLDTGWTDPDGQWDLDDRIVFRLRKVAQD
ncbi:MAG: hypothetical protein ABIT47_01745 [Candidatus Paceibacterota bacterium]